MPHYVVGVDGGNTKTHYALFNTEGTLIDFSRRGVASHEKLPGGFAAAREELRFSIEELLKPHGLKIPDISNAVFGLAGADIPDQQQALSREISSLGFETFRVVNDAFLGIKAGSPDGTGICSINGTGTVCAAIAPDKTMLQIGGLGRVSGDEAGGTLLAEKVIAAIYDSHYRRGSPTAMEQILLERLGIGTLEELLTWQYRKGVPILESADTAFVAANQGDPVALSLLRHMAGITADSVLGALENLDFEPCKLVHVVMAGSVYVLGKNPTLNDTFMNKVQNNSRKPIHFVLLKEAPVAGAVIWALEDYHGAVTVEMRKSVLLGVGQAERVGTKG